MPVYATSKQRQYISALLKKNHLSLRDAADIFCHPEWANADDLSALKASMLIDMLLKMKKEGAAKTAVAAREQAAVEAVPACPYVSNPNWGAF